MRILLYGAYFPPEQIGIGKYTGEMAAWLVRRGHDVRVVTAPPFYPAWRVLDGYSGWRYRRERWQGMLVWRCPIWVPTRQTGVKRVLHLLSFALSSAPIALWQAIWKPNVVVVVAPPLFCTFATLFAARLSSATAWLHLQDLEVDAAFETGLLRRAALRRAAVWIERQIMYRFDIVSTISRTMVSRVVDKGVDRRRCILFPNWVDTETIFPLQGRSAFRGELGIPDTVTVVLYSGNMGEKQGLETILEAARHLSGDSDLLFVMCGDGATRTRLVREYDDLLNVVWMPLQPLASLNDLLNLADIHLLPQRADVADLVMPSKLTGMLASGRPVIATAAAGTQIEEVVAQCGIVVAPGDDRSLAKAIQSLAKDSAERQRLGVAARNYAVDNLNMERTLHDFDKALGEAARK